MSPSFSSNGMTSSGRVAPLGFFGGAEVRSVRAGQTPTEILICHGQQPGGAVIARCAAVAGAKIEPEHPVHCPSGIYLEVLGDPHSIEVTVSHG
jgi:hypothetical protein